MSSEIELDSDGYVSPLRAMVGETHELYEELLYSGYPEGIAATIIGHILSNALDNRSEYGDDDDDDDDDVEDDEDEDGTTAF